MCVCIYIIKQNSRIIDIYIYIYNIEKWVMLTQKEWAWIISCSLSVRVVCSLTSNFSTGWPPATFRELRTGQSVYFNISISISIATAAPPIHWWRCIGAHKPHSPTCFSSCWDAFVAADLCSAVHRGAQTPHTCQDTQNSSHPWPIHCFCRLARHT